MHLHLVAPSSEDSAPIKPLWAAILAAHTPPGVDLTFRDDGLDPIDLDAEHGVPDLVGISVSSKSACRAYRIADAYRGRGSLVVLGGVHATAMPEEASSHADAVVLGEAEWIWREVVRDAQAGRLRRTYRHATWPSLAGLPLPRRDIFVSRRYVPFDVVQTTRGCPYPCEFCSVSTYNGPTFRSRPVREVLAELERVGPRVLFADDNVMLHTRHGRELLESMPALRKQWVGQSSLAALHRPGMVGKLARAGCKALFIGFESVDPETTRGAGKGQNKPHRYEQVVRELADHGIGVWGSFVFGFDRDEPGALERTVEFCVRAKLTMALFAILTPYPGTRLYQRLEAEGRLTMPRWWLGSEHDRDAPFFEPARMTREQLRDSWVRAWLQMYSMRSIAKRYDPGSERGWIQNLGYWPLNLTMRELALRKIAGGTRVWRKARRIRVPFGF